LGVLTGANATAAQQGTPTSYAAVIIDSSAALAASVRAILLDAVVQARAPGGVATLEVDSGVVTIKTTAPLQVGATVTLEISRSGDQLTARVAQAPGPILRGAAQPALPTETTPTPITAAPQTTDNARRAAPITTTAVILTPPPPSSPSSTPRVVTTAAPIAAAPAPAASPQPIAASSAAALLPQDVVVPSSGDPRVARPGRDTAAVSTASSAWSAPSRTIDAKPSPIIVNTLPSPRIVPAPNAAATPAAAGSITAMPGTSADVLQAAAGTRAAGVATPVAPLTPGTTLEVRVMPAVEAEASTLEGSKGEKLPAIVAGALPRDRLIVDTPIGRIAVSVPPTLSDAAPGTKLALEWFPETTKLPLIGDDATVPPSVSRSWPPMRQAVHALLDAHDPALREVGDALIPKPGPRLAQQIMEFIGRGEGDLRQWLGAKLMRQLETLGAIDRTAPSDNAPGRPTQKSNVDGEWRHFTVPLFDGQMLRPIEIHARRRRDERDARTRDQSRFVVECEHDELGAIQIDGLMTTDSGKRRIDVIMRSHAEMPADDRIAIGTLFVDACAAMGLGADIAFQTAQRFPVIAPGITSAHRDVVA